MYMHRRATVPCLSRWQASLNLNNGGNAGVPGVNCNNGLTNANWNILARATDSLILPRMSA